MACKPSAKPLESSARSAPRSSLRMARPSFTFRPRQVPLGTPGAVIFVGAAVVGLGGAVGWGGVAGAAVVGLGGAVGGVAAAALGVAFCHVEASGWAGAVGGT